MTKQNNDDGDDYDQVDDDDDDDDGDDEEDLLHYDVTLFLQNYFRCCRFEVIFELKKITLQFRLAIFPNKADEIKGNVKKEETARSNNFKVSF